MDLTEPTQEAFEKFFEEYYVKVFINNKLKELIKKDLQILIDTKSYKVINN